MIGNTLAEQQDESTNRKFCELITKSLQSDSNAFSALINFNCGGAAGCYDLGSEITQIADKLGEQSFLKLLRSFSTEQKRSIKQFLIVGLEYGYPLNQNTKNRSFEEQFPLLNAALPY